MYDAFETGDVQEFAIEFPESIGAKWAFKGVVTGFSHRCKFRRFN